MMTKSKKAKGKKLEKIIRDKLIECFNFDSDDIRITVGSENGEDVKLSKKAQLKFPFSIEAKNQEIFTTIYKYFEQASSHNKTLIPLLVIKMNRKEPLAILNLDHFLTLINKDLDN